MADKYLFLSHDSRDKEDLVDKLYAELKKIVDESVIFYDKCSIEYLESIPVKVTKGVQQSAVVAVIVTSNTLDNLTRKLSWVKCEIQMACGVEDRSVIYIYDDRPGKLPFPALVKGLSENVAVFDANGQTDPGATKSPCLSSGFEAVAQILKSAFLQKTLPKPQLELPKRDEIASTFLEGVRAILRTQGRENLLARCNWVRPVEQIATARTSPLAHRLFVVFGTPKDRGTYFFKTLDHRHPRTRYELWMDIKEFPETSDLEMAVQSKLQGPINQFSNPLEIGIPWIVKSLSVEFLEKTVQELLKLSKSGSKFKGLDVYLFTDAAQGESSVAFSFWGLFRPKPISLKSWLKSKAQNRGNDVDVWEISLETCISREDAEDWLLLPDVRKCWSFPDDRVADVEWVFKKRILDKVFESYPAPSMADWIDGVNKQIDKEVTS